MNNDNTKFRTDKDEPDPKAMAGELTWASTHASGVVETMIRDENTRYCKWEDQRDDGRKPDDVGGREAEPWPGASDVRIRLADQIVNDQVKLCKTAARKAQFAITTTKGVAYETAGKVRAYLEWLRNTRMRRNVRRETELAAQWRATHGYCVMAVTWAQEWARDYQEVSVQDLQEAAMATPNGAAAQILAVMNETDPDVLRTVAGMLRQIYPDVDQGEALRQLRALQRTGTMSLPIRYMRLNEPRWEALKPWRDVFYPLNTGELQRARWVAWRVILTAAELEEKEISEKWNPQFIEAVKKTKGRSILAVLQQNLAQIDRRRIFQDSAEQMDQLHEVFYFYYTEADADGVPCKYVTVMSPHVMGESGEPLYGRDEPLGYDHGLLPFVEIRRERPDRLLSETRGTAELVLTQQSEVKNMRDARVNQTELFLQPPVIRPEREIGLSLTIRPRGEIGERRAQATRQWIVPNTAPAGDPLEQEARLDADRYFARNRAEDPVRAGIYDDDLASDWCEEMEECWSQTLQLAQQFEDEVMIDRLIGGQHVQLHLSREEIQGEFDISLKFNTDSMDPDRMEKKAQLVQTVVAPLAGGVVDFGVFARGIFSYFFPEFADDALRSGPQADQAEIKDEQNNWALMMAGTEPQMVDKGQNFQMRLQWLQNQLAQPGAAERLAKQPDSQELVEKRLQHLRFQVDQYTVNAQTGRMGVQAGPTEPQS